EAVDPGLFTEPAEKALHAAVNQVEKEAAEAIQKQDFSAAIKALASLRAPIDSFFEEVLVNDENDSIRANRLALLNRIRQATGQVADFSKIAGSQVWIVPAFMQRRNDLPEYVHRERDSYIGEQARKRPGPLQPARRRAARRCTRHGHAGGDNDGEDDES